MKPPTHWSTARLHLRPPVIEDADVLFATYTQDPEVTKYLMWRPHDSAETTRDFVRRCLEQWQDGPTYSWVILTQLDDQLVGMIDLEIHGFRAEIGYVLAKRFWGQGYMTEAVRGLIDWALPQPDIYRVWATCDVENLASARVLEKAGMQREGLLRRWILHPNVSDTPRDSWCYASVK